MPNWCSTNIAFYSENTEQLEAFRKKALEIQNGGATQENDFGEGWLGDYANTFYPEIGAENIECRGTAGDITEIERKDKYHFFRMFTWTAWSAKIGLFYKITMDFYPDVKIAFVSEESGCEYYCKWDDEGLFYPEDYYLDICYPNADGDTEYGEDHEYSTLKSAVEWLNKNLPFKVEFCENEQELENCIRDKMEEYAEEHGLDDDEYFIVLTKYSEVHPSEFSFRFQ